MYGLPSPPILRRKRNCIRVRMSALRWLLASTGPCCWAIGGQPGRMLLLVTAGTVLTVSFTFGPPTP